VRPEGRLRRTADFGRLRVEGRRFSHQLLTVSVLSNDLPHNRYGFVISRRVGKAVQRNRLRRQLREVIRAVHRDLQFGYDVVFVARPALARQPFDHIRRIILQLLVEAGLLDGESD
jgi:ribonuclease P protein component